ncbi:PREDICTED: putative uncharacterized protein FLJ44672 [Rhinopithecus bieti]|uniref:putative uncharacterized protein FLJ44672 n=1 Tax=Rhinopithecus bieti TaxID=61621 RepID=UPI00083BF0C6|nr:PREDICTED: putative uncharacterized protein FLJ44672 [Rhinopithecus bieti]
MSSSQAFQSQLRLHSGLPGLSSCPPMASLGPELPPVGFSGPSAGLPMASACPRHPHVGLSGPSSSLATASSGAERSVGLFLSSFCLLFVFLAQDILKSASSSPSPAPHQPLQNQKLTSSRCLQAQIFPYEGFTPPTSASQWTVCAQLLPLCYLPCPKLVPFSSFDRFNSFL